MSENSRPPSNCWHHEIGWSPPMSVNGFVAAAPLLRLRWYEASLRLSSVCTSARGLCSKLYSSSMVSHVFGNCAVAGFVRSSVLTCTLMQLPHVPSPFCPPGWLVNHAPTTSRYHGTLCI